jgi:hypothetical protein
MIRINTADQAAIIRFCLPNSFYSVDGSTRDIANKALTY